MIQLRTMMPPKMPQTVGSAVCGALLPTNGTLTGGATAGNGASGTLGKLPAALSVAPVKPFPTLDGAAAAVSAAWPATGISGAWRASISGAKLTRTKAQRAAVPGMLPNSVLLSLVWFLAGCCGPGAQVLNFSPNGL